MQDETTLPTIFRKKLPPNLEKIKNGHYSKGDLDYPIHIYLKDCNVRVDEKGSDVVQFLRGKSVLVTGATGFLGKVLVEKLLRCCKDIGKIYVIVRTKKGKDMETRVREFLNNWVFIKLSEIYPNFRDKVVGISGDFEHDGLGLSEESRKMLTEEINIIYHVAATVRFDENLKKAVKVNVKGTREVIRLAKECQKLDVLTYVSTAYSNCIHKKIKEDFYPPTVDPQAIIEITDKLSSDVVDKLTPGVRLLDSIQKRAIRLTGDPELTNNLKSLEHQKNVGDLTLFYRYFHGQYLADVARSTPPRAVYSRSTRRTSTSHRLLGNYPNTYTFTKHLAEHVVRTKSAGVPTCVVRPAVVLSSVREPVRSWMDTVFGPGGLILAIALGFIHVMMGNPKGKSDCVPVDYVINNCIVASYKTAKERKTDRVNIFNFTCSTSNPLTFKKFVEFSSSSGTKVSTATYVSIPWFQFTNCWYWYKFLYFIMHTLPSKIVDFIAVRLGKTPRLSKAYEKVNKFVSVFSYFTLNEWEFETTKTDSLWKSLNEKDRAIFPFDMCALDWPDYFATLMTAIREFILLEFLDNLEEGRKYFKRIAIMYFVSISTILALSLYFLISTIFCFVPITIIIIILYYIFRGSTKITWPF